MDWTLVCGSEVTKFGSYASGFGLDSHPVVNEIDLLIEDQRRPRSDGIAMGRDFLGGTNVEFDFTVFGDSYDDARARRQRLAKAWRGDQVRVKPGALARLVSHTGRTAFGRPRRFAASDALLTKNVATAMGEFVMSDPNWYGAENSATVPFSRGVTTGFKFPAKFPLMTTGERDTRGLVKITGDEPTPLVVEVRGPIVNPIVEIGHIKFELGLSLTAQQRITLNAWPDARTILVNGRASPGVVSSRSTRLSLAVLPPGEYEVVLRGTSESGTASVTVRWRDAFASW